MSLFHQSRAVINLLHQASTKFRTFWTTFKWWVLRAKLPSQCSYFIYHQKICISYQMHDMVRFVTIFGEYKRCWQFQNWAIPRWFQNRNITAHLTMSRICGEAVSLMINKMGASRTQLHPDHPPFGSFAMIVTYSRLFSQWVLHDHNLHTSQIPRWTNLDQRNCDWLLLVSSG